MYKVHDAYSYSKETITLENYNHLVNWLSQFNTHSMSRGIHNTFLDKTGTNENDVYTDIPRFCFTMIDIPYFPRLNRIFDEDGKSAYCTQLIKDVLRTTYDRDKSIEAFWRINGNDKATYYYVGHRLVKNTAIMPFRGGPVPYTGKRYKYKVYRHPHNIGIRRAASDTELGYTVRKRYVDKVPDGWIEERMRDWRNHGWKRQGKNRKQWEAKVKAQTKHNSGNVFVCKPMNDWDGIDDSDMCA